MGLERDEFLQLFIREYNVLRGYTWQFLFNDQLVEDTLQEFAITAIDKLPEIRDRDHFLPWAKITCRNLALKNHRKQKRQPPTFSNEVLELMEDHWKKMDVPGPANRMSALRHCLTKLTPQAKWLIELRYVRNLTFVRVAEELGQSKNTVYSMMVRIHRILGKCIMREILNENQEVKHG
jgi:RNA polymerase sigma-70 factor, ECF subfamily